MCTIWPQDAAEKKESATGYQLRSTKVPIF
jgi:hypothetical protein